MSLISLKGIHKTYHVGKVDTPVLRDVSLTIEPGEFVAIMGPSGSGKSTLMNIMGFLDIPDSGEYIFNGKRVEDFEEDALADVRNREIGFVFQMFYLLSKMSALDNVKLPMLYARVPDDKQDDRAKLALAAVGLEHRMHHKPNELSGGQQQRVSIARALVNEPKIIFADEPTGNLDTASSVEIMDIFSKLNRKGKTIIMVTHEESIAKYAGRIIIIRDGKIVEDKKQAMRA